MSLAEAIALGIIQGITEFLPVSSSGHLVIFKNIFGMKTDMDNVYDIMLHFGTLVAVFIVYWKDISKLIVNGVCMVGGWCCNAGLFLANLFRKDKLEYRKVINSSYRRFVMMIIISTIPTGIIGLVLEKIVGDASEHLLLPGICLLITAALLAGTDRITHDDKGVDRATYKDSLIVGIVQGIATLPGISRSGSTIVAGVGCGFSRAFAVEYSFIMSIPAILGAVVLDIPKIGTLSSPISYYIIGTVVAAVVGFMSIKFMLRVVKGKKFKYFSIYCVCAGILAITCHFIMGR